MCLYKLRQYQRPHHVQNNVISFKQKGELSALLMTYKVLYWSKVYHFRLYCFFKRDNTSSSRARTDNADRCKCTINRSASVLRVAPSSPFIHFRSIFHRYLNFTTSFRHNPFTLVCVYVIISLPLIPRTHVLPDV